MMGVGLNPLDNGVLAVGRWGSTDPDTSRRLAVEPPRYWLFVWANRTAERQSAQRTVPYVLLTELLNFCGLKKACFF